MGYGLGGYYGAGGYGAGGYGTNYGIRWLFALLILIVIVLQFGRNERPNTVIKGSDCCDEDDSSIIAGTGTCTNQQNCQAIDNSVLFVIVVFLLALCGGCWGSGYSGGCGY